MKVIKAEYKKGTLKLRCRIRNKETRELLEDGKVAIVVYLTGKIVIVKVRRLIINEGNVMNFEEEEKK